MGQAVSSDSMVITMTNSWHRKYRNHDEFLSWFLHEQEYVDAMFAQIVMFNFGVWVNTEDMNKSTVRSH